MSPNTLEHVPATSFCYKAARPRVKQYPVLLLASMLATGLITAQTEKDIATIAEETVARLDNSVPKTNEDLLKKELKEQSEVFIELELENHALKDQLKELQQDIAHIRIQNSAETPATNQKSIQLLMEKQNQINALEKQIKEYQSGGNLIPTKIQQPENNTPAKLLQAENEKLMARLDQKEEEYFNLEKRNEKLSAYYEKRLIEKLNSTQILPLAKKAIKTRQTDSISIFDEQRRQNKVQNRESIQNLLPAPSKRVRPHGVEPKSSKFDSLITENPPPLQPIQPVKYNEPKTPVQFDLIKNALAKSSPPQLVPTTIPVADIKPNIAKAAKAMPALTAKIKSAQVSFDVLKSPSNKPDSPPTNSNQAIAPSISAKVKSAQVNFDVLKSPSNKPDSSPTNSNQAIAPSISAKVKSAQVNFDVLKSPSNKPNTSSPETPSAASIGTSESAPENPVIATMFQLWSSDIEYKSLLPPKQPAPSVGIDLLGQRLTKTSTPIGLDGYDISGIYDIPSVKQGPAREPSIPPTTTTPASLPPESGIFEILQNQEVVKSQDPIVEASAITQTNGQIKVTKLKKKKVTSPNSGTLLIEANVEELSGSIKPAYHTEFFITTQDLTDILSNQPALKEEIDREITGKNISSYAELWARAQKYGYNYPGLATKIRRAIKEAGAHRIRTDANGKAQIELEGEDQLKGERYIVGVSPLGTVGVVWSKQFYIQNYAPTKKTLTLEIKDAIWLQ
jgi:hypothetical protein